MNWNCIFRIVLDIFWVLYVLVLAVPVLYECMRRGRLAHALCGIGYLVMMFVLLMATLTDHKIIVLQFRS